MQFKKPNIPLEEIGDSGVEIEPIYKWLSQGRIDCVFVNGENNPSIPVPDVYANEDEEEENGED